jgi:hypothetical protein
LRDRRRFCGSKWRRSRRTCGRRTGPRR